jgi:hypothetical protein
MTEQNRKWSESPIHDQVKQAGLDNAGAILEPDGFFELVKIMQKVQAGEMSCRAGARRFLSDNDQGES